MRLLAIALLVASGAAEARPLFGTGALCRDAKGLAKPCPPGTRREPARAIRPRETGVEPQATAVPAAARPHKRSLFGTGRLCRDAKGLAKPC